MRLFSRMETPRAILFLGGLARSPDSPHLRVLSRFLRTDRLVDEYQFKRFVSTSFDVKSPIHYWSDPYWPRKCKQK